MDTLAAVINLDEALGMAIRPLTQRLGPCFGIAAVRAKSQLFRGRLPDYIERGVDFVETASRLGERLAESAGGCGAEWFQALLRG